MPPVAENYSLGFQVELNKIDSELKKLWAQGEGAMTRASLVNLAVYSEAPGSLEKNTQLIAKIAEHHACRAIVIGADCKTKENRVEAWISAHCHISRTGSKQICSEQISFLLEGPCTNLLPSIVFSHLDSDLPFYLWWQSEFREPMDRQFWAWVDGVIVLNSREVEFVVSRAKCGDLLEVSRGEPGEKRLPQLMPAGSNDPVSLMSEELMRGGLHHVYLHAVNCVRDLL